MVPGTTFKKNWYPEKGSWSAPQGSFLLNSTIVPNIYNITYIMYTYIQAYCLTLRAYRNSFPKGSKKRYFQKEYFF